MYVVRREGCFAGHVTFFWNGNRAFLQHTHLYLLAAEVSVFLYSLGNAGNPTGESVLS